MADRRRAGQLVSSRPHRFDVNIIRGVQHFRKSTVDHRTSERDQQFRRLISFLNQLGVNETVRIAFEAETNGSMNAEIDNVALAFTMSAVPEPSSLVLASLAAGGLLVKRRRSRRKAAQVVAAV